MLFLHEGAGMLESQVKVRVGASLRWSGSRAAGGAFRAHQAREASPLPALEFLVAPFPMMHVAHCACFGDADEAAAHFAPRSGECLGRGLQMGGTFEGC